MVEREESSVIYIHDAEVVPEVAVKIVSEFNSNVFEAKSFESPLFRSQRANNLTKLDVQEETPRRQEEKNCCLWFSQNYNERKKQLTFPTYPKTPYLTSALQFALVPGH
mmetsp:Transcript_11193/g.15393  ORF Transcript_11193/g.15393 Transcript_11193/m.15393 type:complete len:109 (-) Transcript_11193:1688-2014(-)